MVSLTINDKKSIIYSNITHWRYMMKNVFEFVATCLFGLEKLVGEEIDALGYKRLETIDGRVTFEGDFSVFARCNINFRYAERLYLKIGSFEANTFTELFDGTKSLPWEEWIEKTDEFPVKGHSIKSKLFSVPDCQKIVKKAIVERLKSKYNISWFEENTTKKQVEFFIFNDKATLMIDISGVPLHKRGYRAASGEAPLRETLAAAMAKISRPREDVLFWDCFCGSATIPIEAALLMTNTAPNINNSFICEKFNNIDSKVFSDAREEALSNIKRDTTFRAFASDIDENVLQIAKHNIEKAGMTDYIECFSMNALDIKAEGRKGTVVCNPPYGERLSNADEVYKLYADMGKAFSNLDRWQIYILTNDEEFERKYGRRADKIRRLYNGMLRCNYYQFFKPINTKRR